MLTLRSSSLAQLACAIAALAQPALSWAWLHARCGNANYRFAATIVFAIAAAHVVAPRASSPVT